MSRQSHLAFALAVLLSPVAMAAGDGFPDPTFGTNGLQTVGFDIGGSNWDRATGLAVLPDGRVVLAGVVQASSQRIGLARLSANGQPDAEFGIPTFLPQGALQAVPNDLVVQADGKLVIVGSTLLVADQLRTLVCRFEANGTPDLSFATAPPNPLSGTGCRVIEPGNFGYLNAVTMQSNGAIAMAGTVSTNGVLRGLVARLDAQGNPDSSFDSDGVHILPSGSPGNAVLTDITTTVQGDLVAIGDEQLSGNDFDWIVLRLRGEDGSLDPEFNNGNIRSIPIDLVDAGSDLAAAVSVLSNGTIIVAGTADSDTGGCMAIARLTPSGGFDNVLAGDGLYTADEDGACSPNMEVRDMLVQSNGRMVLAINFVDQFVSVRMLRHGVFDPSYGNFGGTSVVDFGGFYGVASTNDEVSRIVNHQGRILMAGAANPNDGSGYDFAVVRLDNDSIFDDDFE